MKKIRKACCVGMAALSMLSSMPVYAAVDETQNAIENSSTHVILNGVESTFSVTVPKNIVGSGKNGTLDYNVAVQGDIAGDEHVVVIPDSSVALKQDKKNDVTASITQDKTNWAANEFDTKGNGTITYDGLSAGEWKGVFNFNIGLENIEYTAFTLTADNYEMARIERTGDVVIPSTFEYNGVNYKVTSIGNNAFKGCTELTSVIIPKNVTDIGNSAFADCTELTSVEIPSSVASIRYRTFKGCTSLTSVEIPSSVTSIVDEAFLNCESLTSVTIPDSVTTISASAFGNCPSLTSVTIPDSVTSIGNGAFNGCTGLTSVTIPDSVTRIGEAAFNNVPHIYYNGTATGSPWGALAIN